ncbi:hypothetical protein K458DRAFT_399013 [Lentithecium fluviatile CBS 122367]|uniref:Uncharacterized protein n=1 Tax=Lentithecium fluviatile CBS 122367 TaxID=1168545 RepID=A0A6G1JKS5_9PLEO|nr:hypothetical protein K458DRAFT_399013 [Lentithecium fluviatile CBS 122367]
MMKLLLALSILLPLAISLPSRDRQPPKHPPLRLLKTPESQQNSDPYKVSPISPDGAPPRNSSGRAQADIDLPIPWSVCSPRILDCQNCPRDFRCNTTSSSTTPALDPPPKAATPPQPPAQEEPAVLTGPQLPFAHQPFPYNANTKRSDCNPFSALATHVCPLFKRTPSDTCGSAATCRKGFCACPPGRKGQGGALRGWTWPDVMNVFVQPGAACGLRCDSLICSAVGRAKDYLGLQSEAPGPKVSALAVAGGQGVADEEVAGGVVGGSERGWGQGTDVDGMEGRDYVAGVVLLTDRW